MSRLPEKVTLRNGENVRVEVLMRACGEIAWLHKNKVSGEVYKALEAWVNGFSFSPDVSALLWERGDLDHQGGRIRLELYQVFSAILTKDTLGEIFLLHPIPRWRERTKLNKIVFDALRKYGAEVF